jgi:tryptophan 2,3-dioxygenase
VLQLGDFVLLVDVLLIRGESNLLLKALLEELLLALDSLRGDGAALGLDLLAAVLVMFNHLLLLWRRGGRELIPSEYIRQL